MQNRIVAVPPLKEKRTNQPTFLHFFMLLWRAFFQLPQKQRVHVSVAGLTLSLCIGLGCMILFEKAAAIEIPKAKMTIATPVNLTVEVSEPPPTIFPQEEGIVPDDSEYVPAEEEVVYVPKKKKKPNASPREVNEVVPNSATAYIQKYHAMAEKSMRTYGVPASITLAQGLIEGNAGNSRLARNANNHFGIKCFSKNCKKGHCVNATDDTHKDFFRKYPSVQKCYDDHGKKLSNGRYSKLKRHGRDYRAWAYGLKSVGYATDRTYAEKLIGIIERYDLHKYDR